MPRDLHVRASGSGASGIDRDALLRLLRLLWPRDEPGFRVRFGLTIGLLAGAALVNALVPLLFAAAIDHLSVDHAALAAPLAILIGYVLLQWLSRILNESRWALYGPIDQRLQRRLALRAIEHLHGLSLRFHLARRTGEISRILDNGLKGLRELVFDAIFLILPFVCEIIFVAATMLVRVDVAFAAHPARHARRLRRGPGDRLGVAARAPAPGGRARRHGARPGDRQPDQLRDDQVLQPRGPDRAPLRRLARRGRAPDRQVAALSQHHRRRAGHDHRLRHGGDAAARHGARGRRRHDARRAGPGQHLPFAAGPPDGAPRPALSLDQAVAGRSGAAAGAARRAARGGRPPGRDAAARRPGRDRLRARLVPLRRRARHPRGRQLRGGAGPQARDRRPDRRRQVQHRPAAVPVLRPERGPHPDRRPGHQPADPGERARRDRGRAAGGGPVQRHDRREHRARPSGRGPGRDRCRGVAPPRSRPSSRPCRTATRRWSASAASSSRAARSSASPSPAPS